jgi:hypothetical protein
MLIYEALRQTLSLHSQQGNHKITFFFDDTVMTINNPRSLGFTAW